MTARPEQHIPTFESVKPWQTSHIEDVNNTSVDTDMIPPPAPEGYALYEHQKLKRSAWLPENIFPTFHIINGYRYVRLEDIAKHSPRTPSTPTRTTPDTSQTSRQDPHLYRCPSDDSVPLEVIVHQALVRQYVYTGDYDADYLALHMYLQRYDRAITALEAVTCSSRDREDAAEKFKIKQTIRIARDALKDEFALFRRDSAGEDGDAGDAYFGFDEFDLGLPSLPKKRPKGYKWVCRC